MSRSALSNFKAKEEEIEKKKTEVREKVQAHLGRVEEESKRLALIREELEALSDPMRKDVAVVRKRIDTVNKELRPLGHNVQKKEKEYKDALSAYDEKNKEKVQLITKLSQKLGSVWLNFRCLLFDASGNREISANFRYKIAFNDWLSIVNKHFHLGFTQFSIEY